MHWALDNSEPSLPVSRAAGLGGPSGAHTVQTAAGGGCLRRALSPPSIGSMQKSPNDTKRCVCLPFCLFIRLVTNSLKRRTTKTSLRYLVQRLHDGTTWTCFSPPTILYLPSCHNRSPLSVHLAPPPAPSSFTSPSFAIPLNQIKSNFI